MKNNFLLITIYLFCACILSTCSRNSKQKQNNSSQNSISETQKKSFKKGDVFEVKVIAITDGDTFKGLTDDKQEIKFRLYAIDAPEKKQAFGQKSKQYLSDLIFGKTVRVKIQKKQDRYGRPVVWVYTPEDKDVSAEMLKAGMAWDYKKYDSTPEYAKLEIEAREARLGLWVDDNPVAPWDFKKKK